MKKILTVVMAALMFAIPVKANAAEEFTEKINDLTQQYIEDADITRITISDVFNYLSDTVKENIRAPLKLGLKMLAVIFLYSIVQVLYENKYGANTVYQSRCTVIVFINLLMPLKDIIEMVSENLYSVKNFMISFLPVYAGISMASGEIFSSQIYTGFFLSALVFISNLCLNIIIPSIKLYFALIISNALSTYIRLGTVSEFYSKTVKNIMKISVSVICFILTVQTTITGGKDTLAVKVGKLLSGSTVPVIGTALQEAVGSVYSSMETIKGFAGAAGLVTVAAIFAPSLIILAVYYCITNVLYIRSDIFDATSIKLCLKGYNDIIRLIISVIVLYMVMLIFALTIMISITNGV